MLVGYWYWEQGELIVMKLIVLIFAMLVAGASAFMRSTRSAVFSARTAAILMKQSGDVTKTDRFVAGLQTATVTSAMLPFSASASVDASPVLIPIGRTSRQEAPEQRAVGSPAVRRALEDDHRGLDARCL